MKRLLSLLVILSMLALPVWAWSYTEGTKVVCSPAKELCVRVPEKAPDMLLFPNVRIVAQQGFANNALLAIVQSANKAGSVEATVVLVRVKDKLAVVAMAAEYARSGEVEFFEDLAFLKTGIPSNTLVRVKEPSKVSEFTKHLDKGVGA